MSDFPATIYTTDFPENLRVQKLHSATMMVVGGIDLEIWAEQKDLEFQARPKKTGKMENVGEIGLSECILLWAEICRPRQPNTVDKCYKIQFWTEFVKKW